jgi:hypothetical protein
MFRFIQIALVLLILSSCKKEPQSTTAVQGKINLADPKAGQISFYRMFEGSGYRDPSSASMSYTGDTLVVELVTDSMSGGWLLKEYFTDGSITSAKIVYQKDAVYTPVTITPNSITILQDSTTTFPSNGSLLFYNQVQSLDLQLLTQEKVVLQSWTTKGFMGNIGMGYTENALINGFTYPRLNVIRDDTEMAVDGPGFTIIYSKTDGIVRTTIANAWTSTGFGFDLIK